MAAPHFIFYYPFCNSIDFYCALHPKKLFLSFSRTFCDYQGDFFKIQGQFKDKLHFFRIPGVFQDQGHFKGVFKVCANPVLHVISNRVFYSLSLYFSLSLELLFCNVGLSCHMYVQMHDPIRFDSISAMSEIAINLDNYLKF